MLYDYLFIIKKIKTLSPITDHEYGLKTTNSWLMVHLDNDNKSMLSLVMIIYE